jgi:flagellar biosynthetic protein FliQ
MSPDIALEAGQAALVVTILLILVMLLPALAVGLLVSMFQAATQINEQTLSFIPKLVVTLAVMLVAGPWMLGLVIDYTERLFRDIPMLLG